MGTVQRTRTGITRLCILWEGYEFYERWTDESDVLEGLGEGARISALRG